jgi:putative ABC transport system ATP-binding protein
MIHIKELNRNFKMGNEVIRALKDINLTIKDGEFISLVGPSGSGKTTLLNIIGGLEHPTSGTLEVNDVNIAKLKDKALSRYRSQSVGYIFQTFNLLPRFTVLRNVMIPAILALGNKDSRDKQAHAALKAVGLQLRTAHLPNKLSGGERQRVSIARAIMNNPSIILADEPTGNLDEKNAKKVIDLLISICKEQKKTLILVTHNPELAKLADRMVEMKNGRIRKVSKQ